MENLTTREFEIMNFIREGYSNKQIARILCISKHTIASHTNNIFRKLHVQNRTHAINLLFLTKRKSVFL